MKISAAGALIAPVKPEPVGPLVPDVKRSGVGSAVNARHHQGPAGVAHIFCDESGGADRANEIFLAAAVSIVPSTAARLLKSFRKSTKIAGEIKGHRLGLRQRGLFFDLLARQPDMVSAVITCSRVELKGGWAMGALAEVDLYRHLLAEACVTVPVMEVMGHLTITPDAMRYKKANLEPVRDHLLEAVSARHPTARVHVAFGQSDEQPGLQVADVIANSVFHSLGKSTDATHVMAMMAPLVEAGHLMIRPIALEGICPDWVQNAVDTQKPP